MESTVIAGLRTTVGLRLSLTDTQNTSWALCVANALILYNQLETNTAQKVKTAE